MKTLAAVVLAGCAGSPTTVEQNELGISQIDVEHTMLDTDRILTVRGLDTDGTELARATLRVGTVVYSPDPDLIPPAQANGTELEFRVLDKVYPTFVTPDLIPHSLKLPPMMTDVARFMRLDAVGAAIKGEAGIWLEQPANGETAYNGHAQTCHSGAFAFNKAQPEECCEDDNFMYHANPDGTGALRWAFDNGGSMQCRTSNGSPGCGFGPYGDIWGTCATGPCGYGITASSNTGHTKAFYPNSNPSVCGWDSDSTGGGWEEPEAYTSQTTYTGTGNSCPNAVCCGDGTGAATMADCMTCAKKASVCGGGNWLNQYGGCYSCQDWIDGCNEQPGSPGCECISELCN